MVRQYSVKYEICEDYHENIAHVELINLIFFTVNVSLVYLYMFYYFFHVVKYVNVTLKD